VLLHFKHSGRGAKEQEMSGGSGAPQPAKKLSILAQVLGLLGAAVGAAVGRHAGLTLLIPAGLALLAGWVLSRCVRLEYLPMTPAAGVLMGQGLWMLLGLAVLRAFDLNALDVVLLVGGGTWLAARPSVVAVAVLGAYEAAGLALNGVVFAQAARGSDVHKALLVHMLFRVTGLVLMVLGLAWVRGRQAQPEESGHDPEEPDAGPARRADVVPSAEEETAAPVFPAAPTGIVAGAPVSRRPPPVDPEAEAFPSGRLRSAREGAVARPRPFPWVLVACVVAAGLVGVVGGGVAVWLAFRAAPASAPLPAPASAPPPLEAEQIPAAWWQPFSPAEGHFQIAFPGPPAAQERTIDIVVGKVKRFAYSKIFGRPQVSFWADYMDLSPEVAGQCPPERCFQWAQDRMVGQLVGGKVLSQKPVNLGPHPGRECWVA
jgi:hypothetical protein